MRPFPRYTYPAKNRHSAKLIVLPPSPKNGAPRQLSPINPSIPRIHLKPLPAQHRVLNSVPKHVANNYRDVVPRNPASCLCFSATEPNFHLKREKERKKKKKERKRRKKQKPPLLVGVSGFVSQPCATLLLPVVRARSNERGQREREIERKREREKVPRGPLLPSAGEQPAGGRVGGGRDLWVLLRGQGEWGRRRVHGEMEGTMATDWRPRTCTRSPSEPTVRAAPTG